MGDYRPKISLERNGAGDLYIGVTEFDSEGFGVRSYTLSSQTSSGSPYGLPVWPADTVMLRRFNDMVRLMGDNVRVGSVEEVR